VTATPQNLSLSKLTTVNQQAAQFSQNGQPNGEEKNVDGVASATSLWGPDDDMGNKMMAKLGEKINNFKDNKTSMNTQKLKDIAR